MNPLNHLMDWDIFEETLDRVKPDKTRGGKGGRPPYIRFPPKAQQKKLGRAFVALANGE